MLASMLSTRTCLTALSVSRLRVGDAPTGPVGTHTLVTITLKDVIRMVSSRILHYALFDTTRLEDESRDGTESA